MCREGGQQTGCFCCPVRAYPSIPRSKCCQDRSARANVFSWEFRKFRVFLSEQVPVPVVFRSMCRCKDLFSLKCIKMNRSQLLLDKEFPVLSVVYVFDKLVSSCKVFSPYFTLKGSVDLRVMKFSYCFMISVCFGSFWFEITK